MLFFAHTGIALVAAFAFERVQNGVLSYKQRSAGSIVDNQHLRINQPVFYEAVNVKTEMSGLLKVDYRFILIGSMLPDIIDKPLGNVILRNVIGNGRIFSHTLLFLVVILLAGFLLKSVYHKDYFFFVAFGVLIHLILDNMWQNPCTLFWPACGFAFPKYDVENWTASLLRHLFNDPATYVPEAIGAAIVIYVSIRLLVRRSVTHFIKTGYLWK